jgi:hypothetical protein
MRWPHLTFILLCIQSVPLFAQNSFPHEWIGKWQGELEIYAGPARVNSLPMVLEIGIIDSLTLTYYITYGSGPDALRPYQLKVIDAEKGQYVLDENNGIRIETSLVGNRLVSLFEVQNSVIQSTTFLVDSIMHYEIYAGSFAPISMTGDTIIGQDTIPRVQTFPIGVSQRAKLRRD